VSDSELTPRQRAFADAYAKHGVAERAAVEAGYSKRTARGSATRLLANAGIRQYLDSLAAATQNTTIATLAELRETWTAVVRGEVDGKHPTWMVRLRASELLAKSLGGFLDRQEIELRPVKITLNLHGKDADREEA
jgi:phage terminase small subunit